MSRPEQKTSNKQLEELLPRMYTYCTTTKQYVPTQPALQFTQEENQLIDQLIDELANSPNPLFQPLTTRKYPPHTSSPPPRSPSPPPHSPSPPPSTTEVEYELETPPLEKMTADQK